MSSSVLVNILTNEIKHFDDVNEITIGRNVTSSIDIPSPFISRTQCAMILTENNDWSLTDLSRHHTTLLNNIPLKGSPILKNGDKISFLHYKEAEFKFYNSLLDVPNPAKKRKLETQTDFPVDVLTPIPIVVNEVETNVIPTSPHNNEIAELNNELAMLREKYDLALEEINNQRRINETITKKLDIVLKESNDTVSSLQKEKEILSSKLMEGENTKEKMVTEIQELNELLKESEVEQIRLNDECKCKQESGSQESKLNVQPELPKGENDPMEPISASEADALQKLVEVVEIKWNEQEMEHMREELMKCKEKITDLNLESAKYQNDILDTLDREMLCSICNDILYEATTLNCRHTFCKPCVVEWKKKKKECPVCRTKIRNEIHPLVIDSFIDKLAETIGGDLKARRAEVKEERASKPTRSSSVGSSRKTPYNRNNRRARGNFNTISSAMSILQPPLVIELSDNFGSAIVSAPVIDLTDSPVAPHRRGRRGPVFGYYNV